MTKLICPLTAVMIAFAGVVGVDDWVDEST
jgi:hypothetical protein